MAVRDNRKHTASPDTPNYQKEKKKRNLNLANPLESPEEGLETRVWGRGFHLGDGPLKK